MAEPPATRGYRGLGAKLQAAGGFFEKNSFFNAIYWITFRTILEQFTRTKFLEFKNQSNKLKCLVLLFT